MCIIAFSGLPQTGKTTLARLLADELHCKCVSFGGFVRQQAIKRGIKEPTRRDLQDLGQALVREDVLAFCRQVLETVHFAPGEQIVLDGIRHKEVLDVISGLALRQPIKLIHVVASIEARIARTTERLNIKAIDAHQVESQIEDDLRPLADILIDGEADLQENLHRLIRWTRTISKTAETAGLSSI